MVDLDESSITEVLGVAKSILDLMKIWLIQQRLNWSNEPFNWIMMRSILMHWLVIPKEFECYSKQWKVREKKKFARNLSYHGLWTVRYSSEWRSKTWSLSTENCRMYRSSGEAKGTCRSRERYSSILSNFISYSRKKSTKMIHAKIVIKNNKSKFFEIRSSSTTSLSFKLMKVYKEISVRVMLTLLLFSLFYATTKKVAKSGLSFWICRNFSAFSYCPFAIRST